MASVVSSVSDGLSGVKCIRWPQWCQVYQMASVVSSVSDGLSGGGCSREVWGGRIQCEYEDGVQWVVGVEG